MINNIHNHLRALNDVLAIYSSWDIKRLANASVRGTGELELFRVYKGISFSSGTMPSSEYI